MTPLPGWAAEMRDLFRSGSAAQFLLHGSVFDVVPHDGKLLSLPAFLEQAMFASYDVVLRYDRSRGVRATRGGDDWGDWIQNALGREAQTQTLMREPGSALELIDRYLLRTLTCRRCRAAPAQNRSASRSSSSSPSSSCRAAMRSSWGDRSRRTP